MSVKAGVAEVAQFPFAVGIVQLRKSREVGLTVACLDQTCLCQILPVPLCSVSWEPAGSLPLELAAQECFLDQRLALRAVFDSTTLPSTSSSLSRG
eukprot:g59835.t1